MCIRNFNVKLAWESNVNYVCFYAIIYWFAQVIYGGWYAQRITRGSFATLLLLPCIYKEVLLFIRLTRGGTSLDCHIWALEHSCFNSGKRLESSSKRIFDMNKTLDMRKRDDETNNRYDAKYSHSMLGQKWYNCKAKFLHHRREREMRKENTQNWKFQWTAVESWTSHIMEDLAEFSSKHHLVLHSSPETRK